jgi:hypothetical protein
VQNADPTKVLQFRLIRNNWSLIMKVAESSVEVDLMNDDHTSWGGDDVTPLQESIVRHICPHFHTTHHTELMVQVTGNIGCTVAARLEYPQEELTTPSLGYNTILPQRK